MSDDEGGWLGTHQGSMHDAFEEGDPGMALLLGELIPVAVERVGGVVEPRVCPGRDAARGEEMVGEMEVRETCVEGALGGNVPAEGDVGETAEGEIRLPLETLDVGAEEGGAAGGSNAEGGLYDGEAGRDRDGRQCVQRKAGKEGGQVHRGCSQTMSSPSDSASSLPRPPPTRPFTFTWGSASIADTASDTAHDTLAARPRVHIPDAWSSSTQGFNGMHLLSPPTLAHTSQPSPMCSTAPTSVTRPQKHTPSSPPYPPPTSPA